MSLLNSLHLQRVAPKPGPATDFGSQSLLVDWLPSSWQLDGSEIHRHFGCGKLPHFGGGRDLMFWRVNALTHLPPWMHFYQNLGREQIGCVSFSDPAQSRTQDFSRFLLLSQKYPRHLKQETHYHCLSGKFWHKTVNRSLLHFSSDQIQLEALTEYLAK